MAGHFAEQLRTILAEAGPMSHDFGLKDACLAYPLAAGSVLGPHAVKSVGDLLAILEACKDEIVLESALPTLLHLLNSKEFMNEVETRNLDVLDRLVETIGSAVENPLIALEIPADDVIGLLTWLEARPKYSEALFARKFVLWTPSRAAAHAEVRFVCQSYVNAVCTSPSSGSEKFWANWIERALGEFCDAKLILSWIADATSSIAASNAAALDSCALPSKLATVVAVSKIHHSPDIHASVLLLSGDVLSSCLHDSHCGDGLKCRAHLATLVAVWKCYEKLQMMPECFRFNRLGMTAAQACSGLWSKSLQLLELLSHKSDSDWHSCISQTCEFVTMLPDELNSMETVTRCSAYFVSTARRLCVEVVDGMATAVLTEVVSSCVKLCRQSQFQTQACSSLVTTLLDVGCKLQRNAALSQQIAVVTVSCLSVSRSLDVTVVESMCELITPHGVGEAPSWLEKKGSMTSQSLYETVLATRFRDCPYLWDIVLWIARGCSQTIPAALTGLISLSFTALIRDLLTQHSQKALHVLPSSFLLSVNSLPAILCGVEALALAYNCPREHCRAVTAFLPCLPPQQAAAVMTTYWRACTGVDTSTGWKAVYLRIAQQHVVSCEAIFPPASVICL